MKGNKNSKSETFLTMPLGELKLQHGRQTLAIDFGGINGQPLN